MGQKKSKFKEKVGNPPGTLVHIGKHKTDKIEVTVIDYDASIYNEFKCKKVSDCFPYKDTTNVSWINVDGLQNIETISAIGQQFNLHPLLLEDVLNTGHRPKAEEYEQYIFVTLKMLGLGKDGQSIISEQVSFVLGPSWLISFQEQQGDIFNALRQRLREQKGNIRQMSVDYLFYRLIDTIVDNYFLVIEHISDESEELEEYVIHNTDNESLNDIQKLKRKLRMLRKLILPLREAISFLQKDINPFIQENTKRYLRDVYEHIIQINENIETQRDTVGSIMDLYHSGVSNRMNQVMKVLTIIATIFIPLTFIAGVYGMNFENIPELRWKYGYFITWGLMLIVTIVMVFYFRKKRWL